jgi:drug/metabolite transporter (DMT)-like permease
MADDRTAQGVLLALVSAVMWGVSGALAAGVFDVVSPAYVAEARSLVALVVLVPYAAWRRVLKPTAPLWKYALLGVNLTIVNVTFYWALDLLGVGPGATIQFLGPIFVLIWIAVVRGSSVRALVWVAAVAAVIGVAMVTQAWTFETSDALGIAAGLAAALTFATYLLFGEHLADSYDPVQIATWGFVFSAIIWLVLLPPWTFPSGIGASAWRDLIIIGLMGTAIPFIMELTALSMVSSGIVGVVATVEPAVGAVSASILLSQSLDPVQWLGVAVVVAAVASVQHWGLPEAHPPTPIA